MELKNNWDLICLYFSYEDELIGDSVPLIRHFFQGCSFEKLFNFKWDVHAQIHGYSWIMSYIYLSLHLRYISISQWLSRDSPYLPLVIISLSIQIFCIVSLSILSWICLLIWGVYFLFFFPWICSWGSSKCYLWQCDRNDNFNVCIEAWDDKSCSAIIIGLHLVKHAFGSWMCILHWRDKKSHKSSGVQ